MNGDPKKILNFFSQNKKFSFLFRGITIFLFLVLAVAFTISITYSVVMEENYRNRKSDSRKDGIQ